MARSGEGGKQGEPQEREDNSIKGRHPSSMFFPLPLPSLHISRSSRANGSLAYFPNRKGFNIRRFDGRCCYDVANNLSRNVKERTDVIYPKYPLVLSRNDARKPGEVSHVIFNTAQHSIQKRSVGFQNFLQLRERMKHIRKRHGKKKCSFLCVSL